MISRHQPISLKLRIIDINYLFADIKNSFVDINNSNWFIDSNEFTWRAIVDMNN